MILPVELAVASLDSAVGTDLGASTARDHAAASLRVRRATEDRQWIHIDVDRARTGPFGTTIAHGFLTLSLASPALADLLAVSDAVLAVNYGLEKVRFPAPVPVGSRIRTRGELVGVTPVPNGRQLTLRLTVEIERAAKPACVADFRRTFLDHTR